MGRQRRSTRNRLGLGYGFGSAMVLASLTLSCAPSVALALSDGRAYEMVTPRYKGGYGVNTILAVAPDGESVAFKSQGAFAGALYDGLNGYLARRTLSGWSTSSLEAPPTLVFPNGGEEPIDFSAGLDASLIQGQPGPDLGGHSRTEDVFLSHQSTAANDEADFHVVGRRLQAVGGVPFKAAYQDASPDFSHLVLHAGSSEPLLPEAVGASGTQLYELVSGGEASSALRLVGLNDSRELIDPFCPVVLGTNTGKAGTFNAVAAGGRDIFFTTNANKSETTKCGGPANPDILYVRINGERTVQVTPPSAEAEFQGANEAGTCVFFTTGQSLVAGDTDKANDLYVARIGHAGESGGPCAPATGTPDTAEVTALTQVSNDPHGNEAAGVQGVMAISPDGSRVYFVAHGVLNDQADAEGRMPASGADNLYVAEADGTGRPVFVADLCSAAEFSGEVRDASCPSGIEAPTEFDAGLWLGGGSFGGAETAAEGRFLLFLTDARLVAGDTDAARDLYRYDAMTGELDRVSEGEGGYHENGNDNAFDVNANLRLPVNYPVASSAGLNNRAINEAGTRLVFTTLEPLSPNAINGLDNAYEWHKEPGWNKGVVSLISSGNSSEPVDDVVMSREGQDVFFITSQGLLTVDTDGAPDVYDARLGGGFPAPPAPPQPCSGDACQGPLSTPAPLLVPGSVSQAAGANIAVPSSKSPRKREKRKSKKAKSKRKPKSRKGKRSIKSVSSTGRRGR